MKVLAIGDIVGEAGVRKLKEELPKIKEQEKIEIQRQIETLQKKLDNLQ